MWEDPIVSDVRRTREELSARFDFDVKAIFADLRNRQASMGQRLVSRQQRVEFLDAADRGECSTSATTIEANAAVPSK